MTDELPLDEKVVALHVALDRARVPHAFGGALALAFYAEPRTTADIDINLFVTTAEHPVVAQAMGPLGADVAVIGTNLDHEGQLRARWGRTPIDLFYAYDAFHAAMRAGTRMVPFGDTDIPILAPEHLVALKAIFNRPRDWVDIDAVIDAGTELNRAEAMAWITRATGADDSRAVRLRAALG